MPDVAFVFGFVWAGLLFASAVLNVVVALNFDVATWAAFMPVYAIARKIGLFMIQYVIMRVIGVLRRRVRMALAVP